MLCVLGCSVHPTCSKYTCTNLNVVSFVSMYLVLPHQFLNVHRLGKSCTIADGEIGGKFHLNMHVHAHTLQTDQYMQPIARILICYTICTYKTIRASALMHDYFFNNFHVNNHGMLNTGKAQVQGQLHMYII